MKPVKFGLSSLVLSLGIAASPKVVLRVRCCSGGRRRPCYGNIVFQQSLTVSSCPTGSRRASPGTSEGQTGVKRLCPHPSIPKYTEYLTQPVRREMTRETVWSHTPTAHIVIIPYPSEGKKHILRKKGRMPSRVNSWEIYMYED